MTEWASEERKGLKVSKGTYVTVSVNFSWMSCFWVLVPTLDKLISSKPDMWPALMRMFGLMHLNFEGSVYPNKTCGQVWMRMFGACG